MPSRFSRWMKSASIKSTATFSYYSSKNLKAVPSDSRQSPQHSRKKRQLSKKSTIPISSRSVSSSARRAAAPSQEKGSSTSAQKKLDRARCCNSVIGDKSDCARRDRIQCARNARYTQSLPLGRLCAFDHVG